MDLFNYVLTQAQTMPPDILEDGYAPFLFVETEDEVLVISMTEHLTTQEKKEHFFSTILPEIVRQTHASGVVFISEAWSLDDHSPDEMLYNLPLSVHPECREILSVAEISRQALRLARADIKRDEKGRRLGIGDWEIKNFSEHEVTGLIPSHLIGLFRL